MMLVRGRAGRAGGLRGVAGLSVLLAAGALTSAVSQVPLDSLRNTFAEPPTAARPMMRWWWFGPAVRADELNRELDQMHSVGIGGVELAAEYPLALDDPSKDLLNLRYASPEYVAMVRSAQEHARSLGMRVDITLGSGWPYGGPEIPIELAAGRLKIVAVPLSAGAGGVPKLAGGDTFIAAFVAQGTPEHYDASTAKQLPDSAMPDSLAQAQSASAQVELFFIASHTRQQVKRAAFGGEGYVLDHMAKPAIERHLHVVGDALLGGFPGNPPYAIFSDSLEVYGSDWTPSLPAEFKARRGYDLIPHLPELAQGGTPEAEAVRRDWGETLSDLVRDNYLHVVAGYATAHGTRFRSQTYGEPAVTLFDEHVPQLPEGEGPQWRAFSFTRWASSVNHVYGNPITSAETWTWLHSPAFRATPLDMKAEADCMFLEGVNQIIGHGFPYSAPGVEEPGWSLYAAAALNAHNPWWPVMPDVMRYLTRVSWALRQGQPVNDVAVLLPEADAQAAFRPGHVSVTDEMHRMITPQLMSAILDAGHNLDYIDIPAATQRGIHYPVLVIPPTARMPLSGVRALQTYVNGGGKVIFIGETPNEAAGLQDANDTPQIRAAVQQLLAKSVHIASESELPQALASALAPDVILADAAGKLGFMHRKLPGADLYFLANTSNETVAWPVHVRASGQVAEWWDPQTGSATMAKPGEIVTFAPYGSRLLVLHEHGAPSGIRVAPVSEPLQQAPIMLTDWTMAFPGSAGSPPAPTERHASDTVWTDHSATRFYSGEVVYTTHFNVKAMKPGEHLTLQFAPAKPLPNTQGPNKPGMRAWLDPPIREAAVVIVNGRRLGSLWYPPYSLDVSSAVHPGENTLELHVYNTAINELAGQRPRDYTALYAKYGPRFQMQDMENLQPVPSGIQGPVALVFSRDAQLSATRSPQAP